MGLSGFYITEVAMAPKRNNIVPNGHFRKDWQRMVKTWFNQPMRKKRRAATRKAKAAAVAPRPVAGLLRPVVRCPTFKYNSKVRLGRGFTLEELKAAGFNKKSCRSIGISVDYRRRNLSMESLQQNVQRLKEGKQMKGDASPEEIQMAKQLSGDVLALKPKTSSNRAKVPTKDEKMFNAVKTVRCARGFAKSVGVREKRMKEQAGKDK